MGLALALARRRLGETWPNPAVGAVVAKEGRILGAAATAPGGRPHAEPQALAEAGAAARGATLYVTLEPCAHTGVTPPCVEAVIAAGIARVVIGARDPDPRVDGRGIARLRAAGIEVTEGVEGEAARALIAGFARRLAEGRPEVPLKLAATLDGRIATREGESKWITAEPARRAAHALRGEMDAVMVGVGTVMADDPRLTCRLPGYRHRPLGRVVVDSHLRTGLTTSLAVTMKEAPTWFLIDEKTDPARRAAFEALGAHLITLPRSPAGVVLRAGLKALGALGLTRLLVEGGGEPRPALDQKAGEPEGSERFKARAEPSGSPAFWSRAGRGSPPPSCATIWWTVWYGSPDRRARGRRRAAPSCATIWWTVWYGSPPPP